MSFWDQALKSFSAQTQVFRVFLPAQEGLVLGGPDAHLPFPDAGLRTVGSNLLCSLSFEALPELLVRRDTFLTKTHPSWG